jgi:hypothetical protein
MLKAASFPNLDLDELLEVVGHAPSHSSPRGEERGAAQSASAARATLSADRLQPLRVAQLQGLAGGRSYSASALARERSPDWLGESPLGRMRGALSAGFGAAFAALDVDGDGVLAAGDLRALCEQLGLRVTDAEVSTRTQFAPSSATP